MIKLSNLMEDFGGPGKAVYASDHVAGMQVPKGGSMCANCKFFYTSDGPKCDSVYWQKWAQTREIPVAADEYCCNWFDYNK